MGLKLYVGNLAFSASEESIRDLFGQHGTVTSCHLITDRDTGRSKGFGFVEMSTEEEAQNAITNLNSQEVDGRALTVNEARPQVKREGRSEGGFRSGGFGGSRAY